MSNSPTAADSLPHADHASHPAAGMHVASNDLPMGFGSSAPGPSPHEAALSGAMPEPQAEEETPGQIASAPVGAQWWDLQHALVFAMLGLMLQLVSFYAREQLPARETAGLPLDRFDTIVGGLPAVDGSIGQMLGPICAAVAILFTLKGYQQGVRLPALQLAVGGIAVLTLLLVPGLDMLVGSGSAA